MAVSEHKVLLVVLVVLVVSIVGAGYVYGYSRCFPAVDGYSGTVAAFPFVGSDGSDYVVLAGYRAVSTINGTSGETLVTCLPTVGMSGNYWVVSFVLSADRTSLYLAGNGCLEGSSGCGESYHERILVRRLDPFTCAMDTIAEFQLGGYVTAVTSFVQDGQEYIALAGAITIGGTAGAGVFDGSPLSAFPQFQRLQSWSSVAFLCVLNATSDDRVATYLFSDLPYLAAEQGPTSCSVVPYAVGVVIHPPGYLNLVVTGTVQTSPSTVVTYEDPTSLFVVTYDVDFLRHANRTAPLVVVGQYVAWTVVSSAFANRTIEDIKMVLSPNAGAGYVVVSSYPIHSPIPSEKDFSIVRFVGSTGIEPVVNLNMWPRKITELMAALISGDNQLYLLVLGSGYTWDDPRSPWWVEHSFTNVSILNDYWFMVYFHARSDAGVIHLDISKPFAPRPVSMRFYGSDYHEVGRAFAMLPSLGALLLVLEVFDSTSSPSYPPPLAGCPAILTTDPTTCYPMATNQYCIPEPCHMSNGNRDEEQRSLCPAGQCPYSAPCPVNHTCPGDGNLYANCGAGQTARTCTAPADQSSAGDQSGAAVVVCDECPGESAPGKPVDWLTIALLAICGVNLVLFAYIINACRTRYQADIDQLCAPVRRLVPSL